jgi:ABC-type lipoprotein release transport system permease subunit
MSSADSAMTLRQWSATVVYIVVMAGITALACVVPTRRALAIEPTEALRTE